MGRPRIDITPDMLRQIEEMAGRGMTEEGCAHVLGMDPRTFRRRKKDTAAVLSALKRGLARTENEIGEVLAARAKKGDLGAIVWWEKTRAGRSERQLHEVSGPDGAALVVKVTEEIVHPMPDADD